MSDSDRYPGSDLDNSYCRNPGADKKGPWCFVTGDSSTPTWEYCNIPSCGEFDVIEIVFLGFIPKLGLIGE